MTNINNDNQSFYLQQQRLKQAQMKKLEDDAEKEKQVEEEENQVEEEQNKQPEQPFEERGDILENAQNLLAMQARRALNLEPVSQTSETQQAIPEEIQQEEQISETEQQNDTSPSAETPKYSNIENKIICDYLGLTTDKDFSDITLN